MIINAGKASSDPVQEKLRQSKKIWNKEVSSFIDDLIHFKKMMNGQPSKFYKEKSFIKEPIPADPVTIIGLLSNDFQDIAQKSSSIIQEQAMYSKNRKKKQLGISPTTPNLSTQLAETIDTYELIAQASNPFSRFFTRLLNPAIGKSPEARVRKYRMSLLNSAADIYKNLKKLQVEVVGSSPKSIFVSSKLFNRIEDNWSFFIKGVDTFKQSMPDTNLGGIISAPIEKKEEDKKEISIPAPPSSVKEVPKVDLFDFENSIQEYKKYLSSINNINSIIDDYKKYAANFLDINFKLMNKLITKYLELVDKFNVDNLSAQDALLIKKQIKDITAKLEEEYNKLIEVLQKKNNSSAGTFREIWEEKSSKQKIASAQLEVVAQEFLKKWYGKTRHQFSLFDKTSAFRLDLYKLSEDTMILIDKIMDSLEKEMNTSDLDPLIKETTSNMLAMRSLLNTLEETLRGQDFDKPFMKLLEKGDVTEYGRNLSDEHKKRLEKSIETKRMRDLSQLYFNRKPL